MQMASLGRQRVAFGYISDTACCKACSMAARAGGASAGKQRVDDCSCKLTAAHYSATLAKETRQQWLFSLQQGMVRVSQWHMLGHGMRGDNQQLGIVLQSCRTGTCSNSWSAVDCNRAWVFGDYINKGDGRLMYIIHVCLLHSLHVQLLLAAVSLLYCTCAS